MARAAAGRLLIVGSLLILLAVAPVAADYSGSLSIGDGGLQGTASWGSDPGTTLYWTVSPNPDGSFHYAYEFHIAEFALSHMIIELTNPVEEGDIFNITSNAGVGAVDIGLHEGPAPGNPNMPDDVYGIKVSANEDAFPYSLEFDSWRLPVWQDWYAKCGGSVNTAWNTGFSSTEEENDPLAPPSNGSLDHHILAPDGHVPEPATMTLFGIGLAGLIGSRLRRRRED